jgi:hypothetical protein
MTPDTPPLEDAMPARHVVCIVLGLLLLASPAAASGGGAPAVEELIGTPAQRCGPSQAEDLHGIRGDLSNPNSRGLRTAGEETLWIFDADFEDLSGDNAGWTSLDVSGTPAVPNYWHKDTIRINGFEWLGDSTWWCGTYNPCWRQPRGYGNNWVCILSRECPEVAELSDEGDQLILNYDQRFALENDYDYGYVEVRGDGDPDWTTVWVVNNVGFAGHPGVGYDWDNLSGPQRGHVTLDVSEFAGRALELRFRFVSDGAYSSQDEYDNPPYHSVHDGAWQLDNIRLDAWSPDSVSVFFDDCESPGDNGWVHDAYPASDQTGVAFQRVFEPDILRGGWCIYWRPEGWWMAALDAETGRMVDGEDTWLISPPIDISGAQTLIGKWDSWFDLPSGSHDMCKDYFACSDESACVTDPEEFVDLSVYGPGGYGVLRGTDDWSNFTGTDWFAVGWRLRNEEPPEPGVEHMTGFMLDRQRVGVPVGGPPTVWDYSIWDRFHDTFDIDEALTDIALVDISDDDGVESARLIVSSDAGQTWDSYPMTRQSPDENTWEAAPPADHIAPSTEIWYYFESTDGAGNVRTNPRYAPNSYYEFSILPIAGSVSEPAILLVDKNGRVIRNEDGEFRQTSERFYTEALDILGYEYDTYDVEVPSGSTLQSNGPDSSAYKYYDTQIWFTGNFDAYTIKPSDQVKLINWLSQSEEGNERNLLLSGNNIGRFLVEEDWGETLNFYSEWLASEYLSDDVAGLNDTLLLLREAPGGFDFLTYDDGECPLRLLEWDYG